jgi:Domain of unknown function (DUF3854)
MTLYQHNGHRKQRYLSQKHEEMLFKESGISAGVVAARGYFTATRRAEVPDMFADYQRRVGLVIPTLSPSGAWSYRLRPDVARKDKKGRERKYEQATGAGCTLDVHPLNLERARDPGEELWIVEGEKKADALTSRGECAISVPGVWNFQRKGEALPCWEHVPLEGRLVRVAYDSDLMRNPDVLDALERLVAFLEVRGAQVLVVYLSDAEDGGKVGVDDFLAGGGAVAELRLMARPYKRPDLAAVRLSRDERLAAGVEDLWRRWRSHPWRSTGDYSTRSLVRALLRIAERRGKLASGGLWVQAAKRTLALEAGISTRGVTRAIPRAEKAGFIRRDNEGRKVDQAGAFILLTSETEGARYCPHDGKGAADPKTEATERNALVSSPYDPGGDTSARPAEKVPELRWPTIKIGRDFDKRGRPVVVYDYIARPGKKRAAIVEYLVERGGVATVPELMVRFAGPRTRARDFKRRTLAMLAEPPAIIVIEGDVVSLGGKWRESLEHARELGGELEAARLLADRYQREREAFRRRDETTPDPVPDMRPIADLRTPWPAHPAGCACPSCAKKWGERSGAGLHVAGCCCADCFEVIKREAHEAGHRVVPLAVRRTRPIKAPPEPEHPWHCDCPECGPEPDYATPFEGAS